MNFRFLFFLPSILIISNSSVIHAQVSWEIKTGSGYNFSSGSELIKNKGAVLSLNGETGYRLEGEKSEASVILRARPELYGFKKGLTSVKAAVQGNFYQAHEDFDFEINLTKQWNIFNKPQLHLFYDIYSGNASGTFFMIEDFYFSLNAGYSYQLAETDAKQKYHIMFFAAEHFNDMAENLRIGLGIYTERFSAFFKEEVTDTAESSSNSGWRTGPQLTINYLSTWIFRMEYRFLFHNSKVTYYPSFDQWIRLLAGKIFFTDFSAFILIDYFTREYKIKSFPEDEFPLLYTPINQENHIYFKLGYDFSETFSVYIRSGYFNENLFFNGLSFSGWNIITGVEITN